MNQGDDLRRLMLLNDFVALEADMARNELAIAQQVQEERRRGRRRDRRYWTRAWLLRRPLLGQYERLMVELREEDVPAFKNFVRMEPRMFQEVLTRLGERIEKKVAITLRYLMRMRYPALQNAVLDQEDENHEVIPCSWRNGANLDDMEQIRGGNYSTTVAKKQRLYLKH